MDQIRMISNIACIARGVAKAVPDKVKLSEKEMHELISGAVAETSDAEEDEQVEQQNEEGRPKQGIRGSVRADDEVDDAPMQQEGDDEDESRTISMRGIAVYASNRDDPYMTNHIDSDDEKDEVEIQPTDNLVVTAKIDSDDYTLEVYVYNSENDDWYCHHDYILDAPPLCLEPIRHDPGNEETELGNLLAVGTMESVISIWDLDIMNGVKPVVTLGKKQKGKRRGKASATSHGDAVLSLAWNKLTPHVLASGSADKSVILWDLDAAKAAQLIDKRAAEVSALAWHPVESPFLLVSTTSGRVEIVDCRDSSTCAHCEGSSSVESARWNPFNPFTAFIAFEDGEIRHVDMRKMTEPLSQVRADDLKCLDVSKLVKGLVATVGQDELVRLWKVDDSGSMELASTSEKLSLGSLLCCSFVPDVPHALVVGGSDEDLSRVLDLRKFDNFASAFS